MYKCMLFLYYVGLHCFTTKGLANSFTMQQIITIKYQKNSTNNSVLLLLLLKAW